MVVFGTVDRPAMLSLGSQERIETARDGTTIDRCCYWRTLRPQKPVVFIASRSSFGKRHPLDNKRDEGHGYFSPGQVTLRLEDDGSFTIAPHEKR